VRKLCKVKEEHKLSKAEIDQLQKHADLGRVLTALKEEGIVEKKATFESIPFYEPKKSADCPDGYAGRIGIHEVLMMSPALKEMVIRNATSDELEAQARKEGMLTMLEDGIFKAAQGLTTIEEVLRVISE
jgi:type II secretory ATPase GspE/PulE/Tfp pilus assembly ATPase PilB-like protein